MTEINKRIPTPPCAVLVLVKVFSCTVPIAQLVIGAKYQFDCPGQRFIPVYLLVMGVISLLLAVLTILPCASSFGNQSKIWACFISLFFVCWFIAGNVWIYSIYELDYESYCNRTVYLFAFWTTNVHYILLGIVLLSTFVKWLICRDDNDTETRHTSGV